MDEAGSPRDEWSDGELLVVLRSPDDPSRRPTRQEALERLFDRYHARVFRQCRRLLADDAAAEDATQEVFLAMFDRPLRYDDRESFGSWLYVVVRNHCLNRLRQRVREVQPEGSDGVAGAWLVDPDDAQENVHRRQLAGLLRRTCEEVLSVREHEVIVLRYVWGLRVKQIGEVLGLTNVSGARTHLTTAHRKLREALSDRLGEEELATLLAEGES